MKRAALMGLTLLAASTAALSGTPNSGERPAPSSKAVRGLAEAHANAGLAAGLAARTVAATPRAASGPLLSSPLHSNNLLRAERLAWLALAQGHPGAEAWLQKIEAHIQRHGVGCSDAARGEQLDIQAGD